MIQLFLSGNLRQSRDENLGSLDMLRFPRFTFSSGRASLALGVTDTVDVAVGSGPTVEVSDCLDSLRRCGNFDEAE